MTVAEMIQEYTGFSIAALLAALLAWVKWGSKHQIDTRTLDERVAERIDVAKANLEKLLLDASAESVDRTRAQIADIEVRYAAVKVELEACQRDRSIDREDSTRRIIALEKQIENLTNQVIHLAREIPPNGVHLIATDVAATSAVATNQGAKQGA